MYAWDSWRTLVPLIIGAAGLVVFGFYERFVAVEPLIRLQVFQSRTAAVNYLGSLIHGMILWSLLYYLPLYYEVVKGLSPIVSAPTPPFLFHDPTDNPTTRFPVSHSSPKPSPWPLPPSPSAFSSP